MATELEQYNIPKTEALLDQYNFGITKYDGVVYLKDSETTNGPIHTGSGTITLRSRTVINSVYIHDGRLNFDYNTSKTAKWSYPHKARKTADYTDEEWFDIFEHIAVTLAKEIGLEVISISTGRTDNRFLKSRGYIRNMDYIGFSFQKNVEDIIADRPGIKEG